MVLCSCPRQNVKLGSFTSWTYNFGRGMYKKNDVRAYQDPMHFCRSRFLSAFLKLPITN